jgi:hypothetical protein
VLLAGHAVQAVRNHDHLISHHGGGSGKPPVRAKGMDTPDQTIRGWFEGQTVTVLDSLP